MMLRSDQRNSTTTQPMAMPIDTISRGPRDLQPTPASQFPHENWRRHDREREHVHTLVATPESSSDPEVLS